MIILIKNIPTDSYHDEFVNLLNPFLKGGIFKTKGNINSLEIIAMKEKDSDPLEFQALVYIEPDAVAQRVIRKLHGQFLRGCRLTVRQYMLRNRMNDKRNEDEARAFEFKDRRTNPDRRRTLKTFKIAVPEFA